MYCSHVPYFLLSLYTCNVDLVPINKLNCLASCVKSFPGYNINKNGSMLKYIHIKDLSTLALKMNHYATLHHGATLTYVVWQLKVHLYSFLH